MRNIDKEKRRGLLSWNDIEFLHRVSDVNNPRDKKRAIREKVKNTFLLDNFRLLNQRIDYYAQYGDHKRPLDFKGQEEKMRDGFVSAIEFIYRLCLTSSIEFDNIVKTAVENVELGGNVEFAVQRDWELDTAIEKAGDGRISELTDREATALLLARPGSISEEVYSELKRSKDRFD